MADNPQDPRRPCGDQPPSSPGGGAGAATRTHLVVLTGGLASATARSSAAERRPLGPDDLQTLTTVRGSGRVRLPADAGEFAPGLDRILRRIPRGCGRRIGVRRGWYALITALDRDIAALDPTYEVLAVEAVSGGLWFDYVAAESVSVDVAVLVEAAEEASRTICAGCGHPGRITGRNGRFAPLCRACSRASAPSTRHDPQSARPTTGGEAPA